MNKIQIIRTFWGTMTPSYLKQIDGCVKDSLNEVVYVWGKDNYDIIKVNYNCILVSDNSYDTSISNSHHFHDYRNMHHKLVCIKMATEQFGEILFLDWDCGLSKELDESFYNTLRNGNPVQAPLYIYPKECLKTLIDDSTNDSMTKFFKVLEKNLETYSYRWNDCYVVPNTGFVYCRDLDIATRLCSLSNEFHLEILVEEFALFMYVSSMTLEQYIKNIEPSVISGKSHGNVIWDQHQIWFNDYISSFIDKDNYFTHN